MTNCAVHSFWLGAQEENGVTQDVHGNLLLYTPWDTHSNVLNPEPNDMTGEELCVRMRGNTYNDAKCELDKTGSARSGIGMAFICEYDSSRGL